MKYHNSIFLFLSTLLLITFGCHSYNSKIESKESVQLGRLNTKNFIDFPDSIKIDSEVSTNINVSWESFRVNHMYVAEEKESTLQYNFTIKQVVSKSCIYQLIDTILPFKFKPSQKGEYTLRFIGQTDTITKKLTVY